VEKFIVSTILGTGHLTPDFSTCDNHLPLAVPSSLVNSISPRVVSIFIAEDDDEALLDLKENVSRAGGCKVIGESFDGRQLIHEVKRLQPDITLVKFCLNGEDGLSLVPQIKQAAPLTKIMVLGTTDNDSHIYASFNAGANGYYLRSTPSGKFISDLLALAEGASWVDPKFSKRNPKSSGKSATKISMAPPSEQCLSQREMAVLRLLSEGLSNQEIGQRLIVSAETVKTHVRHIMEKLSVTDRTLAVVTALRKGIL
jgi:DNA-binding NarL/FixJ family response regulator